MRSVWNRAAICFRSSNRACSSRAKKEVQKRLDAFLQDRSQLSAVSSSLVVIKIDQLMVLAGSLVETSHGSPEASHYPVIQL